MANLKDLVEARKQQIQTSLDLKRVLIYGQPKSGKTMLAASVAKVKGIKRVYWFDLENGSCTLLNPTLELSPEDMSKVEVINLPDTKEFPIAIETMLKFCSYRGKGELAICEAHGKVDCGQCKPKIVLGSAEGMQTTENKPTLVPALNQLGAADCVVIDSLSQLGDSAFEAAIRTTVGDRSSYAKYGEQGRLLSDLLGMLQQARTNIICTTHVTVNEAEDTKKETVIPLCGTRNFSLKVSKYFSTVVYLNLELKKFKAGSSPDYKINIIAGDRLGVKLESLDHAPSMQDLF